MRTPLALLAVAVGCAGSAAPPPPRRVATAPARPPATAGARVAGPVATAHDEDAPEEAATSPACDLSKRSIAEAWRAPECRTDAPARSPARDLSIAMTVRDPLRGGRPATAEIVVASADAEPLTISFAHHCLGMRLIDLVDLELVDGRGASAVPRRRGRAQPGLISGLGTPCPSRYVTVTIPAGDKLRLEIPFDAIAEPQITPPALAPGPLRRGRYRLRALVPIVSERDYVEVGTHVNVE